MCVVSIIYMTGIIGAIYETLTADVIIADLRDTFCHEVKYEPREGEVRNRD